MVGEGIVAYFDLTVSGLDVVGLEGGSAYQTGVGYHTQTPDVNFVGVAQVGVVWVRKELLSSISGAM
jgi:hypothetical protein